MKLDQRALYSLALTSKVFHASSVTNQNTNSNATAPCAAVSASIARSIQANTSSILLDGQLAQDCLLSIPFDSQRSVALIDEVSKHVQFQSTIESLKNPPSSYQGVTTDIWGGLANIQTKASQNGYSSQYEFDTELNSLFVSAQDGHFSISLCTESIFRFSNPVSIFSVSTDGFSRPKVYTASDAFAAANGNGTVSSVDTINGQNASDFLEAYSLNTTFQDPDARYNSVFASFSSASAGDQGGRFVSNAGVWPGFSKVSLQHSNGTTRELTVTANLITAAIRPSRFNFTSGADLFDYYCKPATQSSSSPSPTTSSNSTTTDTPTYAPTATAGPARYPKPVIRNDYNLISGYYLEQDYNDTAVLFVPTFSATGEGPNGGDLPPSTLANFAQIASDFVKMAQAEGKTKIIIDLSSNPGGTTISGFNLFKLFFPQTEIYMANRYRTHTTQKYMLKAYNEFADDYNQTVAFSRPLPRQWAWQGQVNPDGTETNFTSWESWYGPNNFTDGSHVTAATNFNNFSAISVPEGPIQGYGPVATNFTSPPFKGSNIIIMGNAQCASTCPIFVNLMRNHGSSEIRTVVFGGRPNNKPMQLLGGTRGSQLYQFSQLASDASNIFEYAVNRTTVDQKPVLTEAELVEFNKTRPRNPTTFSLVVGGGGVNLRNNYNQDNPELALQFAYEAADCRLYYTLENILVPGSQWYAAAEAIWGGKGCVAGSSSSNSTNGGNHNGGASNYTGTGTAPPNQSPTSTPGPGVGIYPGAATALNSNTGVALLAAGLVAVLVGV